MREIKYKAWDKENKKMYVVSEIYFYGGYIRVDKPATKNDFTRFYNFEDVELMQFTGLHDKNGKEIYEGDLVKLLPPCEEITAVVKIGKFYDEDAEDWFVGVYLESNDVCVSIYAGDGEFLKSCEVIGNIYENPELLEVKSERY